MRESRPDGVGDRLQHNRPFRQADDGGAVEKYTRVMLPLNFQHRGRAVVARHTGQRCDQSSRCRRAARRRRRDLPFDCDLKLHEVKPRRRRGEGGDRAGARRHCHRSFRFSRAGLDGGAGAEDFPVVSDLLDRHGRAGPGHAISGATREIAVGRGEGLARLGDGRRCPFQCFAHANHSSGRVNRDTGRDRARGRGLPAVALASLLIGRGIASAFLRKRERLNQQKSSEERPPQVYKPVSVLVVRSMISPALISRQS